MSIGMTEYLQTVEYFSKLYDYFNVRLFEGVLTKPIITISPDMKNKSYGWLTNEELWQDKENADGRYEMNLSAQFLNRPIFEVSATLLHEMCHQWARENGFQDTTRYGVFHNRLFQKIAETHGLVVEYTNGRGWANSSLSEQGQNLLNEFLMENSEPCIYRKMPLKPKRVRDVSVRKYVCPDCKASVRAFKAVNVWCGDCKTQFQEEKINEQEKK